MTPTKTSKPTPSVASTPIRDEGIAAANAPLDTAVARRLFGAHFVQAILHRGVA